MGSNQNIPDYEVVIDGEHFSLLAIPAADSRLVQAEKANVLKTIQLKELMAKLQRTGDFINLAYNSTPAKYGDIRASIGNIHDRFGVLCGKCMQEMGSIQDTTKTMLPSFIWAFKSLASGRDANALEFMSRACKAAKKLSDSMSALSGEFDKLADLSSQTLQATEKARGQELRNAEELKKSAAVLQASIAEAEELSKRLAKSREDLQALFNEAKEKADQAGDRAFALSMVGAILTPVAQAAGAVAGAYMTARNPVKMFLPPDPPQSRSETSQEKIDGDELKHKKELAEELLKSAKDKEKTASDTLAKEEKKVDAAKAEVADADAAVKAAAADADAKKAAQKALTHAKTAQEDAESLRDGAKAALDKASQETAAASASLAKVVKALADFVQKAGEEMKRQGDSYAAIAEGYRQEKLKYLDLLMAKKDREIEVSANLKRYAVEMKNAGAQEETAEIAAKALFNVIAALRQVVAVLRDMTFFWSNMAAHCDRLADSSVVKNVEMMQGMPMDAKQDMYTDPLFKTEAVTYVAGWVALGCIANEYATASADIRKKVMADYSDYLDDATALAKAKSLGAKLLDDIATDMDAANDDRQAIADEKTATLHESEDARQVA